jgi:DNA polymerase III subunit chi
MSEVWFYHLERQPLEQVLPRILAGMSARGDKVSIHANERTVLEDLSKRLWAHDDMSFIAHGFADEVGAQTQPMLLAVGAEGLSHPYRAHINGCAPSEVASAIRTMIFFEGADEAQVQMARTQWKTFRADGHDVKYWKQNENGRWEDQAAKG